MIRNNIQKLLAWLQQHRQAILAFCTYTLISIILNYPISVRFKSLLPLTPPDHYQHIWSLWWTKKSLLDLHQLPSNLTYLYAPDGMNHPMLWATPLIHILSIPLQMVLGLVPTYNLLALISFPLCGLTMYVLADYLTDNKPAAFIAGMIFAFFPAKSVRWCGHFLQFHIYWFPVYVMYLIKMVREPTIKNGIRCGVSLALSSLVHTIHTAYFIIPVTLLIGLHYLISKRIRLDMPLARASLTAVGVTIVLVLPFYGPYIYDSIKGSGNYVYPGGDLAFSVDALAFFVPPPTHPIWYHVDTVRTYATSLVPIYGTGIESLAYVGWIAIILAIVGLASGGSAPRLWLTITLVAAVLSLGPLLHFDGALVGENYDNIYSYVMLPYAALDQLPFYRYGRTPGRFGETVIFGVAILAAFGARWFMQQIKKQRIQIALVGVISAFIAIDTIVWWPIPAFTLAPVSDFYATLADEPDGVIMIFPEFYRDDRTLHMAEPYNMYFQTIHEHKVTGGYIWRWNARLQGKTTALDELIMADRDLDITDNRHNNQDIAARLNDEGIQYVVVHKPSSKEWVQPGIRSEGLANYKAITTFLDKDRLRAQRVLPNLLGKPIYEDDLLTAFKVPNVAFPDEQRVAFIYLGKGWQPVYYPDGHPWRWIAERGGFYVERRVDGYVQLSFEVASYEANIIHLEANGQYVETFPVYPDSTLHVSAPIYLQQGETQLAFFSKDPCTENPVTYCPVRFSRLSITPVDMPITQDVDVEFDDDIVLEQFSQSAATIQAGETLTLTLLWQTEHVIEEDYKIFVHLLDQDNNLVAQHDAFPDQWRYPTSEWIPGRMIRDITPLFIPDTLSAGEYSLRAGIYHPETGRLPITRSSRPTSDQTIELTTISVVKEGE